MRRYSLSLLIILPFIIILFLPLSSWSLVIALKSEIRQNQDNTYSLNTIIKSDKPTSIKLALRIVKSDSGEITIPIVTTISGIYTFWYDNINLIKNFLIPNSKDIFPYIKDISLIYAESGTDNWQELANDSGKIGVYIDKKGLSNIFVVLPKELSLRISKVNGKMPKDNKVSLSLKNGNEIELELEFYVKDYKTPFIVTSYYILDDQPKKEVGNIMIVGSIQKEALQYKWNGEKRIGVEISVGKLTSTAFVNISPKGFGFNKLWFMIPIAVIVIVIVIVFVIIVLTLFRSRINRSKQQIYKIKMQKESLKVNKESWFGKLWQRKPIKVRNVSLEFSEVSKDNKQFKVIIPNAKDFNGKPDWLKMNRNQSGSSVYIFELYPYYQGERKPGIITFYDKKGRIICTVNVSYKSQVIAKNADISTVFKNITDVREALKKPIISTDVKEEKVDTEKEIIPANIDKEVAQQYRLLITREGRAGKQTLTFPEIISHWENRPDWIKIDESHKNEGKYSFEALSLNNKPEITIRGYNSKKQLVANIVIIPDKSGKKEQITKENYLIDSTSVLKNDGDKIVIVLKRDKNYTEKIRIISEVKPILEDTKIHVKGDIYPSHTIDEEWIASLSIEKNFQKMYDNELKIDVMCSIQNGIPYVICKLPEQSSEGLSKQLINLTLEANGQPLEFRVSEGNKIKLEVTRDGQLKADQSDNPQKITVPNPDNLGSKLISNLYKVLSSPGIDVNEQEKREMRGLLADLIENPDNTKIWMNLLGLKNKEKPTPDRYQNKKEEPVIPPIQEESIDRKNLIADIENKMIQDATDKINKMLKEAEEKAEIILQNAREEAQKIIQGAQTDIEIEKPKIEVKKDEHSQALIDLRNTIEKVSYEGKESDINLLDELIGNIKVINETIGDIGKILADDFGSPILKKLMNWGENLYKRKQSNPQKLDDTWQIYTQIMNDPFNIFVIWKANTSFKSNDHIVDGGSFILGHNVTVTKVINPGFKVSARVRDKQGVIIKKASVQISDT